MYAAFDPGKRTGIATFLSDGTDNSKAAFTDDHLYVALNLMKSRHQERPYTRWIVEDYKLREDKAFDLVGIEGYADRAIGAIKYMAWELDVPITFQGSWILKTALKWARIKPVRGHLPDELSAYAHGVHWLIMNNIRRNPVLDDDG